MVHFKVLEKRDSFSIFLALDSPPMHGIILTIFLRTVLVLCYAFFGMWSVTPHTLNRPKDEMSCKDPSMEVEGVVHDAVAL